MQSILNKALILCWQRPAVSDTRAKTIVEFMGADAEVVSAERELGSLDKLTAKYVTVIVSAATVTKIAERRETGLQGPRSFLKSSHIFVHGFDSSGHYDATLQDVSGGRLRGVQPIAGDVAFKVSAIHRDACQHFSGLHISQINHSRDLCFVGNTCGAGFETLIKAGDKPFFVRLNDGGAEISVVACRELADLGEQVSCEGGLLPWFSRLVPLMIFLRRAFGAQLWHSDLSEACFIIDDPLLKPKYGFLEYRTLLEIMGREKFSACVAFIPWNYRRTSAHIAGRLSAGAGSLSMCVHGCDHTAAEFASTDTQTLIGKGQIALERMRQHARQHRAPFDDVMVFPQGLFSSEALKALDACGYLAAINTDLCPSNGRSDLKLRDLLDVAVTRFGLSLFWRHYPKDVAHFAFDLFLGKPAFVVEHHGYFRSGYQEATEFMRTLSQLDEHVEWQNPAKVCSRACLQRAMPDGKVRVRFFTNRFELTNRSNRSQTYSLFRKWSPNLSLPRVTLNQNEWLGKISGEHLQIDLTLNPGETANVRIITPTIKTGYQAPTGAERAKILIRRFLSEFRDDYVETNPLLCELFSGVRKLRGGRRSSGQTEAVEFNQNKMIQESRAR